MRRRDFVSLVSAAMGTSVILSCKKTLVDNQSSPHMDLMAARGGGGAPAQRYPLKFPGTLSHNGGILDSKIATSDLGGGVISNVWAYNGQFPGPTIRANAGDQVTIQLQNHLPEETITHWHGLIVDHDNDGQPMHAIAQGGTYDYNFTINQRAGLNFYHPHPHMLTGKQVFLGQAGAFIINDSEEAALDLPSGNYEIPLILRDATLDKNNNLSYKPASGGMFGKIPLVNGTRNPYLDVERAVYRLRIVNGANSRIFGLALGNGASFKLIGNDGGLLTSAVAINRIDMSNGERIDVLVDFRSIANGSKIMLRDLRAGWDLLEFRVNSASVGPEVSLPAVLSSISSLGSPVTTRTFSFDAMSKINGREYEMDRIDWQVPLGDVEKWVFRTNGNAPHPVHVHGASFQVVSRTGGRNQLYPWESGWKDTVLLEDSETVEVLIRFNNHRGIYLLHCHKLEHEDMGMMANFEVV
ncbi:MAG TPA: multicopper oxidase domain-containing protein [Chitinophagaceae bacterium]|nr:multicopper oxidase domain-containing protein [Chitinophagaceae bacterium]